MKLIIDYSTRMKEHQILGEDKNKYPLLNFDISNKLIV